LNLQQLFQSLFIEADHYLSADIGLWNTLLTCATAPFPRQHVNITDEMPSRVFLWFLIFSVPSLPNANNK